MPPEKSTLKQLAEFKLATLPAPHHGFTVDLIEANKGGGAKEAITADDTIAEETEAVRLLLQRIGLPEEIMSHPIYPSFLLGDWEGSEHSLSETSPLLKIRNLLGFVPLHPHIQGVRDVLKIVAEHIINEIPEEELDTSEETIEKARTTLIKGMIQILDGNTRTLDEHAVLRKPITPGKTATHRRSARYSFSRNKRPQKLQGVTLKDVRGATKHILRNLKPALEKTRTEETKEKLLEGACIKLMQELGIFDRSMTPSEKAHFLNDEMPSCMSKARTLYKRIGRHLATAQREFGIKGPQVEEELIEENEYRTPIEILQLLTEHSREEESYATGDLHELNEAQTILGLAYSFFLVRRDHRYKAARAKEFKFRRNLAENLFQENNEKEKAEVKLDARGNILEDSTEDHITTKNEELRILNVPEMPEKFQRLRVQFDGSRRKTSEALVIKTLLNPHYELGKNVFDFLGGRIFAWDITLEDYLNSPQKRQIKSGLNAIAMRAGEAIGLIYKKTTREKLRPGEFCIDDKLETNSTNTNSNGFPAIKVYGLTKEGLPVEFQIVLRDGYNTSKSPDSPNSTHFYDLLKDIGLTKIVKPYSIFPQEQKVAKEVLQELENRRKKWETSHQETPATHE